MKNMAKFMDGHIASIDEGIVGDIETLVRVAEIVTDSPLIENKQNLIDAAKRVREYLDIYKLED